MNIRRWNTIPLPMTKGLSSIGQNMNSFLALSLMYDCINKEFLISAISQSLYCTNYQVGLRKKGWIQQQEQEEIAGGAGGAVQRGRREKRGVGGGRGAGGGVEGETEKKMENSYCRTRRIKVRKGYTNQFRRTGKAGGGCTKVE